MSRLFQCRFCGGTRLLRWSNGERGDFVCNHCDDDELNQLCKSKPFLEAPFEIVMTKLRDGRWAAGPKDSYHTYASENPEAAFYTLMKALGWHWDGRWVRWVTS